MTRRLRSGVAMAVVAGALVTVPAVPGAGAADHHRPGRVPADRDPAGRNLPDRPIATWTGTGVATTGLFDTPVGGWDLTYTFDCTRAPGRVGQFIVSAVRTPGEDAMSILRDRPVSRAGTAGAGAVHFPRGGTGVYLLVNSQCSWAVTASR